MRKQVNVFHIIETVDNVLTQINVVYYTELDENNEVKITDQKKIITLLEGLIGGTK